jgi:hypothetical protein
MQRTGRIRRVRQTASQGWTALIDILLRFQPNHHPIQGATLKRCMRPARHPMTVRTCPWAHPGVEPGRKQRQPVSRRFHPPSAVTASFACWARVTWVRSTRRSRTSRGRIPEAGDAENKLGSGSAAQSSGFPGADQATTFFGNAACPMTGPTERHRRCVLLYIHYPRSHGFIRFAVPRISQALHHPGS